MIFYFIMALLFQNYSESFTDFKNEPLKYSINSDTKVYLVVNTMFCKDCVYQIDKFLSDYNNIAYYCLCEQSGILGNKQMIAVMDKLCKPDLFIFRPKRGKIEEFNKLLNSSKTPILIIIKDKKFFFYDHSELFSPKGAFIGGKKLEKLLGKRN